MKRLKKSIADTVQAISDKVFDYNYFRRMAVAGIIADGFKYIEVEQTGDWLTCVDPKSKTWLSIDLYKEFSKLKTVNV